MNRGDQLNSKSKNLELLKQLSLLRQIQALNESEYKELVVLAKRSMKLDGFADLIRKKLCDAANKRQGQTDEANRHASAIMSVVNSI